MDETLEALTSRGDDPEGAITGIDQPHRRLDDATQYDFEIQAFDDSGVRAQEVAQPTLGEGFILGFLAGRACLIRHRGLPSSRV
ncbi:hypothetical protein GCM10009776_12900 [Microbacterium deminutum]|uniref:Uncharacterized protein n=1 Tax=Microbacterium deminutum TaxID=344164 RepID=A0ABN2QHZ2_9MICO